MRSRVSVGGAALVAVAGSLALPATAEAQRVRSIGPVSVSSPARDRDDEERPRQSAARSEASAPSWSPRVASTPREEPAPRHVPSYDGPVRAYERDDGPREIRATPRLRAYERGGRDDGAIDDDRGPVAGPSHGARRARVRFGGGSVYHHDEVGFVEVGGGCGDESLCLVEPFPRRSRFSFGPRLGAAYAALSEEPVVGGGVVAAYRLIPALSLEARGDAWVGLDEADDGAGNFWMGWLSMGTTIFFGGGVLQPTFALGFDLAFMELPETGEVAVLPGFHAGLGLVATITHALDLVFEVRAVALFAEHDLVETAVLLTIGVDWYL